MRKWILVLIVLVLVIASFYWLVPAHARIQQKQSIAVNARAFSREILNEQTWEQWWPRKERSKGAFEYNGNTFRLVEKKFSSLVIAISKGGDSIRTELVFIPFANDSMELTWSGVSPAVASPVQRFQKLLWAREVNSDIGILLEKIRSFYSNEDNLYGFPIRKQLVPDSNLISTSTKTKAAPSTETIYEMINRLKNYIRKNNAKELGYPMLNIYETPANDYITRVAIPVDKRLKDSGAIRYRWMLQGGNILVTEVKGGPHQIERAFHAMEHYIDDHQRTAPAIPFQSLVTDRRQVPDTNQWMTKVYWPVM